jgi:hypothetical protein
MRAKLQQPSLVTVVSAQAGYSDSRLCLSSENDRPVLPVDSLGRLGATSAVLIDACFSAALADAMEVHISGPSRSGRPLTASTLRSRSATGLNAPAASPIRRHSGRWSIGVSADKLPSSTLPSIVL